MQKTAILCAVIISIIATSLIISLQASGQNYNIPSWIKNNARWWADGQVGDADFINGLQWLIKQKILIVPLETNQQNPPVEFSNTACKKDEISDRIVHMTGKFTNGPVTHSYVFLKMAVIDSAGNVVATGDGMIQDIEPYQTRIFDVGAFYSGNFVRCEIEVSSTS